MQKQSRRLTHLDSLRAIAALLVIWLHAAEIYHQVAPAIGNSWLHDVARHLDTGRIGVVLFFAISGFLIPTSLKDEPNAVRRFVVRRFFRLYPVFWLSIPLGYLTVWWPFGRRPDALDALLNFTMMPEWLGAVPAIGLYWTLQVELLFYVFCLGLFSVGLIHRAIAFAFGTGLAIAMFVLLQILERLLGDWRPAGDASFLALNLSAMFLGGLWRKRIDGNPLDWFSRWVLRGTLAFYLGAMPLLAAYAVLWRCITEPFFAISYSIAALLFVLGTGVWTYAPRPLVATGVVSYSLYLIHPPVIYLFAYALVHNSSGWIPDMTLMLLVTFAASIALSAVCYRFVEKPGIALGRKLTRGGHTDAQIPISRDPAARGL